MIQPRQLSFHKAASVVTCRLEPSTTLGLAQGPSGPEMKGALCNEPPCLRNVRNAFAPLYALESIYAPSPSGLIPSFASSLEKTIT